MQIFFGYGVKGALTFSKFCTKGVIGYGLGTSFTFCCTDFFKLWLGRGAQTREWLSIPYIQHRQDNFQLGLGLVVYCLYRLNVRDTLALLVSEPECMDTHS